ncbi:MAG: ATP-binding protein [Steroidobacteraceae bacterium]|nr:ATP-binding protein [Steroidobacteraceae bacterium]
MQDFEKLGVFYLGREVDPATAVPGAEPLLYDSKDLTTHAVCVGMTGSGKTGLCVALLEEAAIDGIPTLVIDPKGDIANLALTFPNLAGSDFQPWVDAAEAARKGQSVEAYAEGVAATWRKGLEEWGQDGARVARFRDAAEVAVYTPGSTSGRPLSVLRSFAPPPAAQASDPAALKDRISTVVSGLLGLLGIAADPMRSREHILLSSIVDAAWREGRALDLPALIASVQKPPFDKVGVFDLDTFYPARERLDLAMAINNLLASPGFATWLEGEALDIQRLLFTPEGKPRIAIVSIAHLSDPERMFLVTLVLNELLAWMRSQPGTSSLRALFYMDEIFGYFPPSAMPPSKLPMLTLLKQARAYGLGLVLATQNPVDLDYKGLSNCGTWFIGRLQTERDKDRVIEGLEGATAGGGWDRATLDKLMSSLGKRVFLMRNVHDDALVLMQTRWALSYLRGPLTLPEIERLTRASRLANPPPAAAAAASAPAPAAAAARPALPGDIAEVFLPAQAGKGVVTYRPRIGASIKLHYVDAKAGLDTWLARTLVAPLADDGREVLWAEGVEAPNLRAELAQEAVLGAAFTELPGAALNAKSYVAWGKSLAQQLYEDGAIELLSCESLKLASQPGESEGDFRSRLQHALRESRDQQVARLRDKYAVKLTSLDDQVRRAEERVAREESQYSQRKLDAALSVGAGLLGALFGGRRGGLGKVATAARSAGRVSAEQGDVGRATESLAVLKQRRDELARDIEAEIAILGASLDPAGIELSRRRVVPRKSDIGIGRVFLAWEPWREDAQGFPASAWNRG